MRSHIKKYSFAFAVSVLIFALIFGCFELTASAQNAGVGVSPLVIETTAEKGGAFVSRFTVTNNLPTPVVVRASVKDVWHDGGRRVEAEPGTQPRSASSWLRFNPSEVVVKPRGTATIEAVVSVPPSASGSYYTMPVFDFSRADGAGGEGPGAKVGFRFQGRIVVTTPDAAPALKIAGGEVAPPTNATPLVLTLDLSNTGNAHLAPAVTFAVVDGSGRLVGRGKMPTRKLMPSESAPASGTWAGELPPGRYNVVSSVSYKAGPDTTKTVVKEITFAVP